MLILYIYLFNQNPGVPGTLAIVPTFFTQKASPYVIQIFVKREDKNFEFGYLMGRIILIYLFPRGGLLAYH